MVSVRTLRISSLAIWLLLVSASFSATAHSAENTPPARQLLPKSDVIVAEFTQPMAFWNHALIRTVREQALKSRQIQAALSSPQADRVRFLQQILESAWGEPWDTAIAKLTHDGVAFSATPGNGKQAGLTLVITAKDQKILTQFVESLKSKVESRLPEQQRGKLYVPAKSDGHEFVKVGAAAYAIVGRQFILGSTEQRLLDALKRHESVAPTKTGNSQPSPQMSLTVNVKQIRQIPGVTKALKLPANDVGQIAFLGGWLDLMRRGDRMTFSVVPVGNSLEITARTSAGRQGIAPGLEGFFADGNKTNAASLLSIPDAIYSASWYRDYRSLWNQRAKLVAKKPLQSLEEGDETIRKQLSVIGAKSAPSRAFSLIGPHFRVVVARQQKSEYRIDLPSRLPGAAMCVDVRDEAAFNAEVVPFFRGASLILAVGEQKMITRKTNYKGAVLASLRFRDDEASAEKGNRVRFNFSPTYTVTRGHFIGGTSESMVQRVIDELDRQAKNKASTASGATEKQRLSFAAAASAIHDYQTTLAGSLVFNNGFSIDGAKQELDLFGSILKSLGEITTESGFDSEGFRYRVRLGRRNSTTGNIKP